MEANTLGSSKYMNEIAQMLAFVAMLCTGADHCSVIPKPQGETFLVEVCRGNIEPRFGIPQQFGKYTIEHLIKPDVLCSVHNRPKDGLHILNDGVIQWEK